MKHNEFKLIKLNSECSNYYYSVDKRNYIHSTTFLLLVKNNLDPNEITVSLRKPVTSGFIFDDIPGEDDLGYIEADSRIFFIKQNQVEIKNIEEKNTSEEQQILFSYQRLLTSGAFAMYQQKVELLSRKLTVFSKLLFKKHDSIEIKKTYINDKFVLYDLMIQNILVWRQLGWIQ